MHSKHIGQTFGQLTITGIAEVYRTKSGAYVQRVTAKCSCGGTRIAHMASITSGDVRACKKCTKEASGRTPRHPLKPTWRAMIGRCHDPKNSGYRNYGARGIEVCTLWRESFENFLNDMGERPTSKHSLDRIDNSRGYDPGNCRWALPHEQQNNKRSNVNVCAGGRTLTLTEWSRALNVTVERLNYPLRHGYTLDQIVEAYLAHDGSGNMTWAKTRKPRARKTEYAPKVPVDYTEIHRLLGIN